MSDVTNHVKVYVALTVGDPAPWFVQRSTSSATYAFHAVAGRYIVLCFYGSAADPAGRAAIDEALACPLFDDEHASFFGVSYDPRDESERRVQERLPGIRFFWDFDGTIGRLYGAVPKDAGPDAGPSTARQFWVVLDPTLRVIATLPFAPDGTERQTLLAYLKHLPPPGRFGGIEIQAPVLILGNVFERDLCRRLVDLYEAHGGQESGFMIEVNQKTIAASNPRHKRRRDYLITELDVIRETQRRVMRRIVPEIQKAYQFRATYMERYIVACYSAEDAGHFNAHRDNTTKGTAHRRFAVSINLNDDFEGGRLSFPEFGPRGYKVPPGAAVVFSCSLLHRVFPVTAGRRYVFLPFLYDEAAAQIRAANSDFLGEGVGAYHPT